MLTSLQAVEAERYRYSSHNHRVIIVLPLPLHYFDFLVDGGDELGLPNESVAARLREVGSFLGVMAGSSVRDDRASDEEDGSCPRRHWSQFHCLSSPSSNGAENEWQSR